MKMQIKGDYLEHTCKAVKSAGRVEGLLALKDDRWMITSEGAANVILSAILVQKEAMEVYERDGYDYVGLDLRKLQSFVKRSDSDLFNLWMEKRTLNIEENDGNAHVELATIDIEDVTGATDKSLGINHEVKFRHDFSFITDFTKGADEIINTDYYFIGCRENGLYLYGEYDNGRIDDFFEWDEFDDVEVDWSVNNYRDQGHEPEKDEAIDVIFGSEFTQELHHPTDTAHISIGNHFPMRILYKLEEGMAISYFQTPRLPSTEDAKVVVPDRVIEKHM